MADTLDAILSVVESSPVAAAMQRSPWGFAIAETLHVIAVALLLGSIAVLDLRLLGWGFRRARADRLAAALLPGIWLAFGAAALTGLILFSTAAARYAVNPAFQLKVGLLAALGLNMLAFRLVVHRSIREWADRRRPPLAARLAGGISLSLWCGVVASGRWIGFV